VAQVVELKARPHSAGSARDIDRAAAAAASRQGAAATAIVTNTLTASRARRVAGGHGATAVSVRPSTHTFAAAGGLERDIKQALMHQVSIEEGVHGPNAPTQTESAGCDVKSAKLSASLSSQQSVGPSEAPVVTLGWREACRTISIGGLARDGNEGSVRRSTSRKPSRAARGVWGGGGDVGGLTTVFGGRRTDAAAHTQHSDSDDGEGQHVNGSNSPADATVAGPFSMLGSVLADVFMEQQRLAKAQGRIAACLEALYPNGRSSGAVHRPKAKWGMVRACVEIIAYGRS
jgi:hypothetical protein